MCFSSPKTPPLPDAPKPPPQAAKTPQPPIRRTQGGAPVGSIAGGTMLTGPNGIENAMLSTGKTMLGQ